METKKNRKKKNTLVNILITAGLLMFLCGTIDANSEFNTPLAASNPTTAIPVLSHTTFFDLTY